jgi:filamentous hemagglutinin
VSHFVGPPQVIPTKVSVWLLGATERGTVIESTLAKTEYKGWYRVGAEQRGFFPKVDFQKGTELVSLKTTNSVKQIGKLKTHINKLAEGAEINGQPANITLDVRVPSGMKEKFQELIQYGADRGIKVVIQEIEKKVKVNKVVYVRKS